MYAILIVCTGNICRSPTAEAVLRHKITERGLDGRLRVESAGLIDHHIGKPPDPRAIAAAAPRYRLDDLRARQVVAEDLTAFDLILCMTHRHLRELREMAPPDRAEAVRLFLDFGPAAGQEVPDPFWRGDDAFADVLRLLEDGADGLLDHLARQGFGNE